jgi:hypothetical protein
MKGSTLIFRVGKLIPEARLWNDASPDLAFLQKAVGGWIQGVPDWRTIDVAGQIQPCVAYCNENGKLEGLPLNPAATLAWDAALRRVKDEVGFVVYPNGLRKEDGDLTDALVGDVVVVTGDAEFMRRHIDGDEDDEA